MTRHAWQRVMERLTAQERAQIEVGVQCAALECGSDEFLAARVLRLQGQRNQSWGEQSNGDEVWAIIRRGAVATVMLRRHTQPSTPAALRVDRVLFL